MRLIRLGPRSKTLLISLVTLLIFNSFAAGCALFKDNSGPAPTYGPRSQVFYADFDAVWRATQIAVTAYPIRVNNYDLGVIETEEIDGYKAWTPPHREPRPDGRSYKLNIKVVKGKINGREANKVSVLKEAFKQRDFFSEAENLTSDGLEEKSILYRIERELTIDRALQRSLKRQNSF